MVADRFRVTQHAAAVLKFVDWNDLRDRRALYGSEHIARILEPANERISSHDPRLVTGRLDDKQFGDWIELDPQVGNEDRAHWYAHSNLSHKPERATAPTVPGLRRPDQHSAGIEPNGHANLCWGAAPIGLFPEGVNGSPALTQSAAAA